MVAQFPLPALCPEHSVELTKVQKEWQGRFYLISQCPICLKVAPVFAVSSFKWKDIPEISDINDDFMRYIESCSKNWVATDN